MKRLINILAVSSLIFAVEGKVVRGQRKSIFEIGPKGSFYIGKDAYFGIGAECLINPMRSVGVRLNITEIIFGNTTHFYLNSGGWELSGMSLDGLFYIPLPDFEPYIHCGLGFEVSDTPGPHGTETFLSFRFGMGLNYPVNPKARVFVEPGILIYDAGNTEAVFRFSFGARFGVF